jgi:hypothetical protein
VIVAYLSAGARDVAAGCEEESVPLAVELHAGAAADLARAAARAAPAGIGIGGDDATLVIALATWPHPYVSAPIGDARLIGHTAARLAARRPLPFPAE